MNMDAAKNVDELIHIGETSAKVEVKPDHLPMEFNLKK
jgi:hypothetical protein